MAREKIHIDLVLNTKGFRPLGRINGQLGEFEKSLDASNARVLAFGASAGAILAVKKAFTATVKAAIEVEKSLQDINVILGATSQNLRKFGSDLFEIASKTGQAFQVAATAATELARQGLGTEETLKRTRDALILARLAGMDAAEAVNALTAAINTFNKAGLDSTAIINKLANVDAAFAVSSDDLAKALGRVGASAQAAGVNFDQLLAIVTTVQQKTARGGAVIGNSFKTIFTRIQRPRVIKELENLGIAIRGVEGEVLPAMKVLQNLARQFDNLSQSQKAQITELIGGVFQVNILKAAMSDLSKETGIYNRALGVSVGSSDQALKRNEELNKTLSAQFQRTVNTFKEGAAELGELTLGPTLERLFGFVDDLSKFSETDMGKVGGAIAKSIFEGIGKFISGPGLLVIGLVLFKTFSQLGKFAADAFKTLTGLNKNLQNQMNLQRQVFDVLSENPDLLKKIKNGTMSVEDAHQAIFKQIEKNTGALDSQLLVSQQLAQSLMKGGVGFSSDFGATTGKKPRKFGSAGYIPNFAADRGERLGMMAGGYSSSQIKNPKTRRETIHDGKGGVFDATVNGHESVFTTENRKGKKATFVVPPKNSDAYDKYMSVLSGGFIPNFNQSEIEKQKEYLKKLRAWQTNKSAHGGMPPLPSKADKTNHLGNQAGPIFGLKLGSTPSLPTILSKAEAAHKKFKHNYEKSLSKDRTGQDEPVDLSGTKKYDYIKGKRQAISGTRVYDAKQKFGLLGLYGTKNTNQGYAEASISQIAKYKDVNTKNKKIGFKNLQYRSITESLKDSHQTGPFSQKIRKHYSKPTTDLANEFSKEMLGNDAIKAANIGGKGKALFPKGAEGEIFETVVNSLTDRNASAEAFERALASDPNKTWDFEESGGPNNLFRKRFGFSKGMMKADAKRTLNDKAGSSLVNKIFNTKGDFEWRRDMDALKRSTPRPGKKKAAGGYIPNFNALFEAVRRERDAGVPAGRIRVGRSDRLKNGANPSGFGIYNTRDEPMGLNQGINNSMAAGIDPKRKGMASGYFPNFVPWNKGMNKGEVTGAGFSWSSKGVGDFKESKKSSKSTEKNTKALQKNSNTGMKTIGGLMLLQQATTGLQNVMGDSNNVAQGMVGGLASVATALITVKFALDSLPDDFAKKTQKKIGGFGDDFGKRKGGRTGKTKLGKFWSGTEGIGRDGASTDLIFPGREKTFKGRMRAKGRRFQQRGGLRGSMGRGFGKAMGGGLMKAAGGLAAVSGVANIMENTDLSATFKEARLAGKAFERIKEETEKNIGKLNAFGTAAEQAMATFEDQSASIGQVIEASRKMEKEMMKLPAEMRAKLGGLVDPTQIASMKEQLIANEQKKTTEAEQRKTGADLVRDTRSRGWSHLLSSGGMGTTGAGNWLSTGGWKEMLTLGFADTNANIQGKTKEEFEMEDKQLEQLAGRMIGDAQTKMGSAEFGKLDLDTILGDLGSAAHDDADALKKHAAKLGITESDMVILSKAFQEGGNVSAQLVNGLAKSSISLQQDIKISEASRKGREDLLRATKQANQAIRDQKRLLELDQKIRKEVMKITKQGAQAFLTEVGKINLDEMVSLGEAQEESAKKIGQATTQVQTAFSKTGDALGTGEGAQIGTDIQAILGKAGRGGKVTEAEVSTQAEAIDKLIQKFTKEGDDNQKAQISSLESLKGELLALNGTQKNALKDLHDQTKEIKEVSKAQRMVARQQQRLKSFGGPQALLDPSKLNNPLTQIMSGGKAMAAAGRAGSATGVRRGRINQLAGMQELFGGALPEKLRKKGVADATQVGIQQMSMLNQSLGMGLSKEEIRKAASEQAANLFKGDPMKQNTGALETLTKTLQTKDDLIRHSSQDQITIGRAQAGAAHSQMQRYSRFQGGMSDIRRGYEWRAGRQGNRFSRIHEKSLRGYTGSDFWGDVGQGATGGGMMGMMYGAMGGTAVLPGGGTLAGGSILGLLGALAGGFGGGVKGGFNYAFGGHSEDEARAAGGARYGGTQADKLMEERIKRGQAAINVNLGGITANGKFSDEDAEMVGERVKAETVGMLQRLKSIQKTVKETNPEAYNRNDFENQHLAVDPRFLKNQPK